MMAGTKPAATGPFETLQRLVSPQSTTVARELLELAIQQDPQIVIRRSLDLSRALNVVAKEAISRPLDATAAPFLLRRLCEELGATYVKLGQFVASSPTLFPPEFVSEFQKCLDQTPPMPWSVVQPLIEAELGKPLDQVYSSVEQTPLASASIAQVHAAKLRSGEDVVIKVQKKDVQGSLKADLDLIYSLARTLELGGLATAELSEIVETLRDAILEETDFVKEAANTEQFRQFVERSAELEGIVTAPKVYPEASAKRVLTLERLYGVPLTDLEAVRQVTPQPELALIVALNTWVSSVLTNEWFHADVHAGNLLVLNDGRVAFIDFGIVGRIPEKTALAMVDFVRAFPEGDMSGVAKALTAMGFTGSEVDVDSFAADLKEVLDSIEQIDPNASVAGDIDESQLNRLVASVAKVADNYGIRFPREFALLVKQVLYFDRYTRLLAPGLDVMNDERMAMNRPPPTSAAAPTPMAPAAGSAVEEESAPVVDVEVLSD